MTAVQLHHDMRQTAEGFARQLARTGVELSFDREGVVALDTYVDGNRALWSKEDCERLGPVLAAFLGECMATTYGLEWRSEPTGLPVLALPTGGVAVPLGVVLARMDGGPSLTAWFDEIGTRIAASG